MQKWLCERTWLAVASFADEGRDVEPRRAYFSELEKESDLSLEPLKSELPADTVILDQGDPCQMWNLQN